MSACQSPAGPVVDEPPDDDDPPEDDVPPDEDEPSEPRDDVDPPDELEDPDDERSLDFGVSRFVGETSDDPSVEPDGSFDERSPESVEPVAEPVAEPSSPPAAALVLDAFADDRSFFAQPVPLKWIDGAEKALRTGAAAQTGHASGPPADRPWITSKRWPFGQR